MNVAPDRAEGIDRDGDVVMVDLEGAEVEGRKPLVFERLRGGSFRTEDGGSVTF